MMGDERNLQARSVKSKPKEWGETKTKQQQH